MFRKNYKTLVNLLAELCAHQWTGRNDHGSLGYLVSELQSQSGRALGGGRRAANAASRIARAFASSVRNPERVRQWSLDREREYRYCPGYIRDEPSTSSRVGSVVQANLFARRLLAEFGVEQVVCEAFNCIKPGDQMFVERHNWRRWQRWVNREFFPTFTCS